MARPKKDNADYFSHDNGMRNHRKVKMLRAKFWHEWFSIWIMLLEHLCSCDHFLAPINEFEISALSWDFATEINKFEQILEFLLQIWLLQKEWNFIKSQSLIDRMTPMVEKRVKERTRVSVAETPQSKVKESKIKKIKEDDQKIDFKQKARAVETKWNYIIKLWNEKTWRNDMMEQSTFQSFLNLIYNLDIQDFEKRVSKFIFIKKFIITAWVDKYLSKKIQRYDISMFLKNINLFATDPRGIIASIAEREYANKIAGVYSVYNDPVDKKKVEPIDKKPSTPLDPIEAKKKLQEMRSKLLSK